MMVFLLAVVFGDFLLTCMRCQGMNLSEVMSACDTIVINNKYGSIGGFFFESFPFFLIASMIGADVFYEEREKGIHNDIFTRISSAKYARYQALAVMTVTFFTIVFVIGISQCLALTAFPIQGYTIDQITAYSTLLPQPNTVFGGLRAVSPYLNNVVYALLWGVTGAVFALLSYALSYVHQLKRYVVLLAPMLLFLIYTVAVQNISSQLSSLKWSVYVETYLLKVNGMGSFWAYILIYAVICGFSFLLIRRGLKNDRELL